MKKDIQLYEYLLLPGYIFMNHEPTLISTVLGSGVAVTVWDSKKEYGGMTNYLYPRAERRAEMTALYGNVAIKCLIDMFLESGSLAKNMRAQIFGGARSASVECVRVGKENIRMARVILREQRIKVVSEDVGGSLGRKIVYNNFKNEAMVYKVNVLRSGDWYPYLKRSRKT
ncbi:MAG: chemotaxis protein CheD [Deltaproteobacteria bacterium]|nr:chemotaxis protein CheD [Deltaproteobacteria bacterium]